MKIDYYHICGNYPIEDQFDKKKSKYDTLIDYPISNLFKKKPSQFSQVLGKF
jgi:hypothetical protein